MSAWRVLETELNKKVKDNEKWETPKESFNTINNTKEYKRIENKIKITSILQLKLQLPLPRDSQLILIYGIVLSRQARQVYEHNTASESDHRLWMR